MTLYIALNETRETLDASLNLDFVCRAGVCGSCGMLINGRPGLACRTLTKDIGPTINLAPLPAFELIVDLSVNTGKWMRAMSERLETWIHAREKYVDLSLSFGMQKGPPMWGSLGRSASNRGSDAISMILAASQVAPISLA